MIMYENENRLLPVMGYTEYQELVSVACYAIEHGFDVFYEGSGNLIVRLKQCNDKTANSHDPN